MTTPTPPLSSLPVNPNRFYPYIEDPKTGRRLFDDVAVQKQLDAKVAQLKPNESYAFIAHGDSDGNFTLSALVKKGEHWTFAGVVDHSTTVKFRAEAEVRFSG